MCAHVMCAGAVVPACAAMARTMASQSASGIGDEARLLIAVVAVVAVFAVVALHIQSIGLRQSLDPRQSLGH